VVEIEAVGYQVVQFHFPPATTLMPVWKSFGTIPLLR